MEIDCSLSKLEFVRNLFSPALNEPMKRKRVGLWPVALDREHQWLWCALQQLFSLSFVGWESDESPRWDALIAGVSDHSPRFPCGSDEQSSF
jgi:hypothetical protein